MTAEVSAAASIISEILAADAERWCSLNMIPTAALHTKKPAHQSFHVRAA